MCGIIGYLGPKPAVPILLDSLHRLEYRGYDSAGIAVVDAQGRATSVRVAGKVAGLAERVAAVAPSGTIGLGHTRWATHGRPTEANAHPLTDCDGRHYVVHNGIIENADALREELRAAGHHFRSETDTEVVPHLIEAAYQGDLAVAVRTACARLRGAFALVVLSVADPRTLVAARHDSPLVVGVGDGEWFVSSDIPATLPYTRQVIVLGDGQMAVIGATGPVVSTIDDGVACAARVLRVEWDELSAQREGYPHFMLKEIHEQPAATAAALRGRLQDDGRVVLPEWDLGPDRVAAFERVRLVAAGSAYYAGMVAAIAIEELAGLPAEVAVSSEVRYQDRPTDPSVLTVAISQSGETADTLAAARAAKDRGSHVVALCNVIGSSLAREADGLVTLHAGPEIGVAATKTFVTQVACGILVALHLAVARGRLGPGARAEVARALRAVPAAQERLLADPTRIAEAGEWLATRPGALFIGRGVNHACAMESALKLKEISYLHAEGYPAGELKHGPIALLDGRLPVVALATAARTTAKLHANIAEVAARDTPVIAVVSEGDTDLGGRVERLLVVPRVPELVSPLVNVLVGQLLAYHAAVARDCDVDQPRNLAKSVTVE